ncbi:hypothetical protein [Lactiplantibacillus garii]|uniref:hypothetical protein n=1 Tax=Lactiplantibacillus garii TaxID=2306423 RepID=UPI00131538F1|nr:hypothetical protein [Lactiplantibacillus garii]
MSEKAWEIIGDVLGKIVLWLGYIFIVLPIALIGLGIVTITIYFIWGIFALN